MKHFRLAAAAVLVVVVLSGCGIARSLTTRHYGFNYAIKSPPPLDSTVGTPADMPFVVASNAVIADDLVSKFDKYHGGVDWAGLNYTATLSRGEAATVKFLVSLTAPTGSVGQYVVPADAVQLEDFTLTTAAPQLVVTEPSTAPNAALVTFMNTMLRNNNGGAITVYLYFKISSPSGGHLALTGISIKGIAHGSLF